MFYIILHKRVANSLEDRSVRREVGRAIELSLADIFESIKNRVHIGRL